MYFIHLLVLLVCEASISFILRSENLTHCISENWYKNKRVKKSRNWRLRAVFFLATFTFIVRGHFIQSLLQFSSKSYQTFQVGLFRVDLFFHRKNNIFSQLKENSFCVNKKNHFEIINLSLCMLIFLKFFKLIFGLKNQIGFLVQVVTQCSETNGKTIFRFLVFEIWSILYSRLLETCSRQKSPIN